MQVIKNNTTLLVSLLSAYLIFLVISVANDLVALKFMILKMGLSLSTSMLLTATQPYLILSFSFFSLRFSSMREFGYIVAIRDYVFGVLRT